MTLKPDRKLKLNSETLMTLKSTTLDRVRGGIADVPDFDGAKTDRCSPSQSGPATCPVRGDDKKWL
jgi:hypothetical protein